MREIKKIIVHCSMSEWGDKDEIDRWHRERGWDEIGYHFVILNGYSKSTKKFSYLNDGLVEEGRTLNKPGAHCKGHNQDSIGICLIGKYHFTSRQLLATLPQLLYHCMKVFKLEPEDIYGHYELNERKTCPNIDMYLVRKLALLSKMREWD